jgi:Flp pilus assembly protein TadD
VLHIGALVAVSAIVASFAMETLQRNAVWRSPIALWRESVELAPRHPRPRLLLAESLQDAGRWDEAVEQCRIAVELRPSDPAAHVAFGRSLAYLKRWDEARNEFHTALDQDPGNVVARRSLLALDSLEARFVRR